MSAGPQVAWDEQSSTPPQSVQWDEEKKPAPESFWQKAWRVGNTPIKSSLGGDAGIMADAGGASKAFGELGGMARESAENQQTENLTKTAQTGEKPSLWNRAIQYGKNALGSTLGMASGATSPSGLATLGAAALAPEIAGPAMIAHGSYNAIKNAPQAVKGNPEAAEQSLGGLSEAAGGGAVTGGALTTKPTVRASLADTTTAKVARPVADIAQNAVNRLRTPPAQDAFTQAIQPSVRTPKAQESISIAGPRMQQIRQAQGIEIPAKGPEALKTVLELNRQAKGQILDAIEDRMGPVADLKPTAKSVADGIRSAVDDLTVEQTPGLKDSIERRASTYDKEGGNNWSIRQMENRMHTLNNRLANAYSQATPGEARISAETEMDLAEARELRKTIDSSVENLSGEGVKDLKREYGAQRDVEKSLARQYAVATRVKGAPLWEGLAYLQAAGDLASGGVWGAAKAAGRIAIGNRLQMLRDPGYLANQAFHGPKAFEAAEAIPPHGGLPAPKGLLPSPATEAGFPPSDTSGPVRGGRYTTPRAALSGEKPIEAEFVPRRIPTQLERAGVSRMLPESTTPKTTIPPAVEPKFTREAVGPNDETKLGRTGEGGVRVPPTKGLLPAEGETGTPAPPTPSTIRVPPEIIKNGIAAASRAKTPNPKMMKDIGLTLRGEFPPGYHDFQDLQTGGTVAFKKEGFTEQGLRDKVNAHREAMRNTPPEGKSDLAAEKARNAQARAEKPPRIQDEMTEHERADAEGTILQEVGMMQSADRPGRYFDAYGEEDAPTAYGLRGGWKHGDRASGQWRGVKSSRNMMPFMREHPEISPSAAAKAIEKDGDNPLYQRMMRQALEFIHRQKGQ